MEHYIRYGRLVIYSLYSYLTPVRLWTYFEMQQKKPLNEENSGLYMKETFEMLNWNSV